MNKLQSIIFLLIAVVCIWGAGMRHDSLINMRADYRLDSAEPLENAPPLIAFTTVALGGFKGILVDILWLRASFLQDQGRYFELVQLADWITKLEPHVTEIWAFHAGNMAYNISAMMSDPEDRWRWIRNGIRLLTDEGLLYNSGDMNLYCEIGWLFQHKIGGTADKDSVYFKIKWAEEMENILGGPRPDYEKLNSMPEVARRMHEEYELLPDLMREIDSLYGPLDWRLPESHSLYWAYRGRKKAREPARNAAHSVAGGGLSLPCDRMIYQSMSALFLNGNLSFSRENNRFITEPRFDLLPSALKAYEESLAALRHATRGYGGQAERNIENVEEAYKNFLIKAVIVLNKSGRVRESREIFGILHGKFPVSAASGFEDFINKTP